MAKIFYACLAVMITISGAGCIKDKSKPLSVTDYSDSVYFKAEGIGQSETEARNQALAEMSRIFEAEVSSDTFDRASEIIDTAGNEVFRGNIESNIRVISAVKLEGVRIARTWFDKEKGNYRALAVLDRHQAAENWRSEIKDIDNKIEGEFRLLDTINSKFLKLGSLMKILDHWVEREVLVSRLRVLGFNDAGIRSYDIKRAFYMIPQTKAEMLVFLMITGEYASEIENKLTESLNGAGFVLSNRRDKADVLITGAVAAEPVELKNPGWKFARARISLSIVDALTGSIIGEVSDNARAGHLTYKESVHKAIKKISTTASEKLIEFFK